MRHYWGTSPIGSRRTKPPISTPDAGVTGAGWTGGHGRAATRRRAKRDRQVSRAGGPSDARHNAEAAAPVTGHDTRYGALHPLRGTTPDQKRCTAYRSGAHSITRTNAESARRRPTQRGGRGTRYGARHPLRSATPITGHDTRSEEVHCLRIGCAPNHKNKRGICETTTDTTRRPLHPLRGTTPDQKRCTAYGSGATPNHKNKRGICETIADTHKAPGARSV